MSFAPPRKSTEEVIRSLAANRHAQFSKFSMPLIAKGYPKLLADKLVNVQPMQDHWRYLPAAPPEFTDAIGHWLRELLGNYDIKVDTEDGIICVMLSDTFKSNYSIYCLSSHLRVFGPLCAAGAAQPTEHSFLYEDPELFDKLEELIA